MSIRRPALWIAYGLLFAFYTVVLFSPPPLGEMVKGEVIARRDLWPVAGRFLAAVNVFFPVIAGILSSDRVQRDFRLGLRELQQSTPLRPSTYVAAKFFAALAACLAPVFVWALLVAAVMVADGHTPPAFLYAVPVAFLAITVPAFAFAVAFSLAGPLAMPLPVYQILFTGYWFWANFVPPRLFPTLNGTLLTPGGAIALQGFFGGPPTSAARAAGGRLAQLVHTAPEAALNLLVLAACVALVLSTLAVHLGRQTRRA